MGSDQAEKLAEQLFDTLYKYYLKLDDDVIIYPTHGHGSPCGASIGDRLTSTIGYERKFNPFLQHPKKKEFKEYALSTAPPEPTYYKRMKKLNAKGPQVLGHLPIVPGLPPKAFKAAMKSGDHVVVDTRLMLAFGGGHIEGALNIGGLPELSIWAGWLLDPAKPLLLVLENDGDLEKVVPPVFADRLLKVRGLSGRRHEGLGQRRAAAGGDPSNHRSRAEEARRGVSDR